jgi:transcription elongation factor Elf1
MRISKMADFVDMQYVNLLAGRLKRFQIKHRNPLKVNFRCIFCGDSQKSDKKARGWIIENPKSSTLFYNCFNCGASHSFRQFLKLQDHSLYNEYIADKFLNDGKKLIDISETTQKPVFHKNPLSSIKKISQLKFDHPVKKYIEQRKIPSNKHYKLYYAPKFKTWINTIIPNKFPSFKKDEPRLILPFIDENGKCFGVSARGFDPNGLRYITIMFQDVPKIFGLDKVDFTKTYFVVEGALDSLFLPNAIAMAGADGNVTGLKHLENAIFVFDAESRNAEIVKRMEKLIRKGYNVCIWPANLPGKDINEIYLAGIRNIDKLIKENTFSGLEASLKLASWRKT